MSRILLSAGVQRDFDRIFDFLFEHAADHAVARIEAIRDRYDVRENTVFVLAIRSRRERNCKL